MRKAKVAAIGILSILSTLINVISGSPARADTCTPAKHCYSELHWPVLRMYGIQYRVYPACLHAGFPDEYFITAEGWLGTDQAEPSSNYWVESGRAYGYPNGESQYIFTAENKPSGGYHEWWIQNDSNPTDSDMFVIYLVSTNTWGITLNGRVIGESDNNPSPSADGDAGVETNGDESTVSADISNLGWEDSQHTFHLNWNTTNYHPTIIQQGGIHVTEVTPYSYYSFATDTNTCNLLRKQPQQPATKLTAESAKAAALHMAKTNGESTPQNISEVSTTKNTIADLAADKVAPDQADRPVDLIQMSGKFTGYSAKIPAGKKPPQGTVMTVALDKETGKVLEWGISNNPLNLAKLGAAHAL
jgi:hypothetical protein